MLLGELRVLTGGETLLILYSILQNQVLISVVRRGTVLFLRSVEHVSSKATPFLATPKALRGGEPPSLPTLPSFHELRQSATHPINYSRTSDYYCESIAESCLAQPPGFGIEAERARCKTPPWRLFAGFSNPLNVAVHTQIP